MSYQPARPSPQEATELQKAIDDLAKSGGGVFRLPPGDLRLSSTLVLQSGVTVDGAGQTRVVGPWGREALRVAPGATDVGIRNVDIHLSQGSQLGILLTGGANNIDIDGCHISGEGPGMGVSANGPGRGISISNCSFAQVSTGVRFADTAGDVTLRANRFSDWEQRAIAFINTKRDTVGIFVSEAIIGPPRPHGSVRQPIQFNGSSKAGFRDVRILDNSVIGPGIDDKDPSGRGTADQISLHWCDGFEIAANTVTGGGEVGITVARGSRNGSIVRNTCTGNDSAGICVGSMSGPKVFDILVEANNCKGNGRDGGGHLPDTARSGIAIRNAARISIRGNSLLAGEPASQVYGVSIAASHSVTEESNVFDGNLRKDSLTFQHPKEREQL